MAATSSLGERLPCLLYCVWYLLPQRHPYPLCWAPQFWANTIHPRIPLRVCCKCIVHRTSVLFCLSHILSGLFLFQSVNLKIVASLPPLGRPTRGTCQRRHCQPRLQEEAHRIFVLRGSIAGSVHGHFGEGMIGARGSYECRSRTHFNHYLMLEISVHVLSSPCVNCYKMSVLILSPLTSTLTYPDANIFVSVCWFFSAVHTVDQTGSDTSVLMSETFTKGITNLPPLVHTSHTARSLSRLEIRGHELISAK